MIKIIEWLCVQCDKGHVFIHGAQKPKIRIDLVENRVAFNADKNALEI